jgi:hypothetical protein
MTNVTQGPSPDVFTKTGGTNNAWDSQVYSQQGYVRGVFVTSKISSTTGYAMIGLNSDPTTNASYISIDYAFYFNNATVSIYESGGSIGSFGSYTVDSVAYVTYDGYNVRYYLDGTLLRTVARSIGSPLHLDSSIYNTNLAFTNVGFGPMGESGTSGTSGTGFNTVSNPADNRVLTSDGTTNAAVAESNLTFDGTILNITRTTGNGSLYGTGDLVLETDSTFYIGAYTARPLYINSANGASGTVYVSSAGLLGVGTTSPASKLTISGGSLGSTSGDRVLLQNFTTTTTNVDNLEITNIRIGNGSDWYTSGHRIQQKVDSTWMGYIQFNGGNIGGLSIGAGTTTSSPTSVTQVMSINVGTVDITGVLTATIKSFVIDHPTKPGMKLQYGVLEGPEHSVYVRGRLKGDNTIILPDHWVNLVDENTITVNLTPIGKHQNLYVKSSDYEKVIVGSEDYIDCYYTIFAERKDVDKLITEY